MVYTSCSCCGEEFKFTTLNKKIFESRDNYLKRNSEEMQMELDQNFWTMFTYWENQNNQSEMLLCSNCSLEVCEFIKNKASQRIKNQK
nr:hypothetical protein [uncultured archaeon]